jgi:hypothetical protein
MRGVIVNQCHVRSNYPFRIYSKSKSVDPKLLDPVKYETGDGFCKDIFITDNDFEGAIQVVTTSNKTKKKHENIVLKRNEVWK